ncbi:class II fructose-bisphosphate aldolase [Isoptericola halotolerans]|uniref:class II fructose-bisphosphate aldolase n=1 Tax=Isoptericola halotolerans TaxID=300560 RepID=UPI00388D5BD1
MPHVPMEELLARVEADGTGLGAMNVIALEHAEAIVAGAEAARRPVVLQISENTIQYHGSIAPLALACLRIAEESSAPVSVHLDHATDQSLVRRAVDLGIGSVMFDASRLPHDDNVGETAAMALWCHERGASIEAELGEVGGKDGVHAPGVRTKPVEAARFVETTAVDSLAVAVGSSHAMETRDARLDEPLIREIAADVPVPLVLHGSSGVPDDGLQAAVAAGMRKINIATHLNLQMTQAVLEAITTGRRGDPRGYLGAGRTAVADEVERLLRLLAAPSTAPEASLQSSDAS